MTERLPIVVSPDGRADYAKIQDAVAAAPPGARILIKPGSYEESVVVKGEVELFADGPAGSVVVLSTNSAITVLNGSVTIHGLTLRQRRSLQGRLGRLTRRSNDGDAPMPKGLAAQKTAAVTVDGGHVTLVDCELSAETGLALTAEGRTTVLKMQGCSIRRMTGGIAVLAGSKATLEDCKFSGWILDAVWTKGPVSTLEVRRCTFDNGVGQALFVDGGATATIEENTFGEVSAAVYISDADTEALIKKNTIDRCRAVGIGVANGARAVLDANIVTSSGRGINVVQKTTRVEILGGRLDGNGEGIVLHAGASVVAEDLEVIGGETGILAANRGTKVELRRCRIRETSTFGMTAQDGAVMSVDGGELTDNKIGLFSEGAGTQVTIRGVAAHGQTGPAISIGAASKATIEANDLFDNDYPGIVTVGGVVRIVGNRIHENRSNGIAIREGADAHIEGNEVWANVLPAITVVGDGTQARIDDNTVRDNEGQGIYVYQGASAEVTANRLPDNGGPAITVSDPGSSAKIVRNTIERGDTGIWVADGAEATVIDNEIASASGPGLLITDGAKVEAKNNGVQGAAIGVLIEDSEGTFTRNRLRGNRAGSWCLINAGPLRRADNVEDSLNVPGWIATVLDPAKYPIFAERISAELAVTPSDVEHLASAYSLVALAERLEKAQIGDWSELVHKHMSAKRQLTVEADKTAHEAAAGSGSALAGIVAHLEVSTESEASTRPTRATSIPGVVETLSVRDASGMGSPLLVSDPAVDIDALFAAGEKRIRDELGVSEIPPEVLGVKAFAITGPYSGSAALLHLSEWCPQVLGGFGALVLAGDAERLIVVPVDDASIVYALPSLAGAAGGSWIKAAWKLRPVLVWLSPDRTDIFEAEIGPFDTVASVRAPADLAALLARLPEPAVRIPAGWQDEVGLTAEESAQLLTVVRLELLARMSADIGQLPELSARLLVDLASAAHASTRDRWTDDVRAYFDVLVNERRLLDHLTTNAPYEEAKAHLWIQLDRAGAGSATGIQRTIAESLVSSLMVSSGGRKRNAARSLAPHWGVTEETMWADATANMLAADLHVEDLGGPLRKYGMGDREGEAVGLLLHRLPNPPASGHLLALIHKGAAYSIRIDDRASINNVAQFAAFITMIHARAAAFDDELSSHMFWLRADGTAVDLFDATDKVLPPPPPEFVELANRLAGTS